MFVLYIFFLFIYFIAVLLIPEAVFHTVADNTLSFKIIIARVIAAAIPLLIKRTTKRGEERKILVNFVISV